MRALRTLPLLAAVAGCCCGDDLETHEGIADATIVVTEDLVDTLEGITDKKSAESARPGLLKIVNRMKGIQTALRNLGEPSADETKRLNAKVDAALAKIDTRMTEATERIRAVPEAWAVVDPVMTDFVGAMRR